jgi:hypothetical protein
VISNTSGRDSAGRRPPLDRLQAIALELRHRHRFKRDHEGPSCPNRTGHPNIQCMIYSRQTQVFDYNRLSLSILNQTPFGGELRDKLVLR